MCSTRAKKSEWFSKMNQKILVLTTIPAPYRNGIFEIINKEFDTSVFYERLFDDNRNSNWFILNEKFEILNCKKSKLIYKKTIKKIKDFDLVAMYEYATITSIRLMIRCILNKVPYVINCDGAYITTNIIKGNIKKFFIKKATAYLASGISAKNYFMHYGAKEENIYFHNFSSLYSKDLLTSILTKDEKEKAKKVLQINNEKVVLGVGRFISLKRYDILIKAWKEVNSNYKLIIIGGGEERENYKKLIEENHLNNIKLIDFKTKEELHEYYKAADLFVHPTSTDTWGLVINEAMACGLPVITTDKCVAGLELIKDNENGFIVPVGDMNQLVQRIKTILNDDNLREKMSKNNLEAIRPYTIENMAKSQISTFKEILKK